LELDSELMLLAFSQDDQNKIRDFALEEDLTRKQISELTTRLNRASIAGQNSPEILTDKDIILWLIFCAFYNLIINGLPTLRIKSLLC
jgi:hypothetical protein